MWKTCTCPLHSGAETTTGLQMPATSVFYWLRSPTWCTTSESLSGIILTLSGAWMPLGGCTMKLLIWWGNTHEHQISYMYQQVMWKCVCLISVKVLIFFSQILLYFHMQENYESEDAQFSIVSIWNTLAIFCLLMAKYKASVAKKKKKKASVATIVLSFKPSDIWKDLYNYSVFLYNFKSTLLPFYLYPG